MKLKEDWPLKMAKQFKIFVCNSCWYSLLLHPLSPWVISALSASVKRSKAKIGKKKKKISIHFVVALSILGGVSVGKVNLRLFCFQKGSKNKKGSHRVNCWVLPFEIIWCRKHSKILSGRDIKSCSETIKISLKKKNHCSLMVLLYEN